MIPRSLALLAMLAWVGCPDEARAAPVPGPDTDPDKGMSGNLRPGNVPVAPDVARILLEAALGSLATAESLADVSAAEAEVDLAGRTWMPTLSTQAGVSSLRGSIFGAFAGGASGGQAGGIGALPLESDKGWPSAGVSVNQPLFDGWRGDAQYRAATARLEGARARARYTRTTAVLDAWRQWLALEDLGGDRLVLESRQAIAAEKAHRLEIQVRIGTAGDLALQQARLAVTRLERQLSALLDREGLQERDLAQRYGPAVADLARTGAVLRLPLASETPVDPWPSTLLAASASVAVAREQERGVRAGRWPQAAAFVTATAAGPEWDKRTLIGGASVTWQPIDLGRTTAQESQAGAQRRRAEAALARTWLDHARQVDQARSAEALATDNVSLARTHLQLELRARDESLARRSQGTADALESLEREGAVIEAQVALERAERDLMRAHLDLAQALGIDPESLTVVTRR